MKWISVEDRLPKMGLNVLTFNPMNSDEYEVEVDCTIDDFESKTRWDWGGVDEVTHWMPLPDPPKDKEQ